MNTVVEMGIKYNIETGELIVNDKRLGSYNRKWAANMVKDAFEQKAANAKFEKVVRNAC